MTSDDQDADSAPAPACPAATGGDDTTVVPPPTHAAAELAWSLDDDDDPEPVERQSWGVVWGQVAVLVSGAAVIALVIAVVGWTLMRSPHDGSPLPPAQPVTAAPHSPVAPPVAAPKPSPVTAHAAPRTVAAKAPPVPRTKTAHSDPELSAGPLATKESESVYDERLLDSLRSLGYVITDRRAVLRNAHEACRLLQQGESAQQVNDEIAAQTGAHMADVLQLTSSAMLSYPNCG